MIKNIKDELNSLYYYHEYYCDKCFCKIENGEIYEYEAAKIFHFFDLCEECYNKFFYKTKEVAKEIPIKENRGENAEN